MTRRGWLKAVAGVVAGLWARMRGKAQVRGGSSPRIVVALRARERGSIITVERDRVVAAVTRIPIGDYHFGNDVWMCLHLPPEAERDAGARWHGRAVLEARAEEFALFVRNGLEELGVGPDFEAPVMVTGARFPGLAAVMERVLDRPVSTLDW